MPNAIPLRFGTLTPSIVAGNFPPDEKCLPKLDPTESGLRFVPFDWDCFQPSTIFPLPFRVQSIPIPAPATSLSLNPISFVELVVVVGLDLVPVEVDEKDAEGGSGTEEEDEMEMD